MDGNVTDDAANDGRARAARIALRLGVATQCVALAWTVHVSNSDVATFALLDLGWSLEACERLDTVLSVLLVVAAITSLVRPIRFVLWSVAALFLAEMAAHALGGERFSDVAPAAHAVRYVAPAALVLFERGGVRGRTVAEWALRVATAATFAGHGYEAWVASPKFVDLLLAFDLRLRELGLGLGLDEAAARSVLHVVAIHDFVLAALVVALRRVRAVPAWMAVWGGSAALARVVEGGAAVWALAALRAANAAAPAAVALLPLAPTPRRDAVAAASERVAG